VHEKGVEIAFREQPDGGVLFRHDCCRLRLAVEQGHLPEKIPPFANDEDLLLAVRAQPDHLDLAGEDDIHVVLRVILHENDGILLVGFPGDYLFQPRALVVMQAGKERYLLQRGIVVLGMATVHGIPL